MKAAFGAEAIGLGYEDDVNDTLAVLNPVTRRAVCDALDIPSRGSRSTDPTNPRPWVAEIVGLHPRYRFERRFLGHKTDYRQTSGTRNRGVWFWWTLESGHVYEVSYRTSWGSGYQRRFITVTEHGEITDLNEKEVREWLAKSPSASTS